MASWNKENILTTYSVNFPDLLRYYKRFLNLFAFEPLYLSIIFEVDAYLIAKRDKDGS